MLCYAMLCYAMLCYAMLCYAMLCYALRKGSLNGLGVAGVPEDPDGALLLRLVSVREHGMDRLQTEVGTGHYETLLPFIYKMVH